MFHTKHTQCHSPMCLLNPKAQEMSLVQPSDTIKDEDGDLHISASPSSLGLILWQVLHCTSDSHQRGRVSQLLTVVTNLVTTSLFSINSFHLIFLKSYFWDCLFNKLYTSKSLSQVWLSEGTCTRTAGSLEPRKPPLKFGFWNWITHQSSGNKDNTRGKWVAMTPGVFQLHILCDSHLYWVGMRHRWEKQYSLYQWFLKCGPWTSSISIPWELLRTTDYCVLSQSFETNLGDGVSPEISDFRSLPCDADGMLRNKNHNSTGIVLWNLDMMTD